MTLSGGSSQGIRARFVSHRPPEDRIGILARICETRGVYAGSFVAGRVLLGYTESRSDGFNGKYRRDPNE
jgi:hypothetical protein